MSNKLWGSLLAIAAVLPLGVQAQDEAAAATAEATPPAEEAAAADPAPADAASTEAAPAEAAAESTPAADTSAEAAPADAAPADASAEAAPAETPAAEDASAEAPAEETPAEPAGEREPFELYAGADRSRLTFSASDDTLRQNFDPTASAPNRRMDYDSYFYTLRAGIRMFHAIGFEGQYGIKDDSGNDSGQVEVKDFFAFYLVPTATVFNLIELSARLGYASFEVSNNTASNDSDGVSFGVGIELPIKQFAEFLPDIRLTGGATVWHVSEDSRSYGLHYGLRYDFKI